MAKSKLQKGLYPIKMGVVRRAIKTAENWGYSNKEIGNYVAEVLIDTIDSIDDTLIVDQIDLSDEIRTLVHRMLNGDQLRTFDIELQKQKV